MNREIKFRAYIKNDYKKELIGKILEVSSIHFKTRKVIIGYSLGKSDYGNKSFSFNDIELMQYIGFYDKNGKEIYEGDVVYCQTKFGKAKAIIKFIDGKFVAYWDSTLTHPQNGHHIACYEINKRFEVLRKYIRK